LDVAQKLWGEKMSVEVWVRSNWNSPMPIFNVAKKDLSTDYFTFLARSRLGGATVETAYDGTVLSNIGVPYQDLGEAWHFAVLNLEVTNNVEVTAELVLDGISYGKSGSATVTSESTTAKDVVLTLGGRL
jgi:hypothetical protein